MGMNIRGVYVPDNDLNQRFQGNYIEIVHPESKLPELVHVNVFVDNYMHLHDGRRWMCDAIKIVRDFPELGAVEYNRTVHYLSRLPLRQWTRGLNAGVISDFCRGTDRRFNQGLNMDRAKAVFYPTYTKLGEGLEKIKKEEVVAFAYNPKFWFSGNKKRAYLWYEDVPIGEVSPERVLFFNEHCLSLKQEVKDEFKNALQTID